MTKDGHKAFLTWQKEMLKAIDPDLYEKKQKEKADSFWSSKKRRKKKT
jgi:hypothetical protein